MQRRYKALIAIIIPIIFIALLNIIYPVSYNILMGYMMAIVLVFKSSLISLWLISKLKILAFIKSLTMVQAFMLGVKRWFIDNMLSKWLDRYIIRHLKKPFNEISQYYRVVSLKSHSGNIEDIELAGNSVKFIKTKNHLNFNKKDIYFEFNNKKVSLICIWYYRKIYN